MEKTYYTKKLSIIVPVYNMCEGGKLDFCLRSLLAQTVKDFEIIAVDDASTDHSFACLKKYEQEYPGIVRAFTTGENLRQGGAKNLGLRVATGEWVGFVDADDFVSCSMYEKLLAKATDTGADCVGCFYSLVHEQSFTPGTIDVNNPPDQTGLLDETKYKSLLLNPGSMVVKIYKRDMILNNKLFFPEHVFYEDNCMSPIWMLHCTHFEQVTEPLYFYYQNDTSTVHTITLERCMDRCTVMNLFLDQARNLEYDKLYPKEIEYKYTELYFINTLFSLLYGRVKGRTSLIKKMRTEMLMRFPAFEQNKYYIKRTDPEQKKLIHMLMESPFRFRLFFRLLTLYRKWRYGK